MPEWNHPTLGKFIAGYTGWQRDFHLPALSRCTYEWGGGFRVQSNTTVEFAFPDDFDEDEDELVYPQPTAATLAETVIRDIEKLVDRCLDAIYAELTGCGIKSMMWWNGDLATINERITSVFSGRIDAPTTLGTRDDLLSLLGNASIRIRDSAYQFEFPHAIFQFSAAFDDEHGIGVVTDGKSMLGSGYQNDPFPYS